MNLRPNYANSIDARTSSQKLSLPTWKVLSIASMVAMLFAIAGATTIKTITEHKSDDISFASNPACKDISLLEVGRSVHVGAGQIELKGKTIDISAQTIQIPPSPPLEINAEKFSLFSATDEHPYFTRVPVACLAGGIKNGGPVGFLIDEDSLTIEDETGRRLVADLDYKLDLRYDSIERLKSSAIAEGAPVKLRYKVLRKRIDTLSVDHRGIFKLTTGNLSQFAPTPAPLSSNDLPVAHICAVSGNNFLTRTCIMPISGATSRHTSVEDMCFNAMNLANTKKQTSKSQKN